MLGMIQIYQEWVVPLSQVLSIFIVFCVLLGISYYSYFDDYIYQTIFTLILAVLFLTFFLSASIKFVWVQ